MYTFADIILPLPVGQVYTYQLEPEHELQCAPGKRVIVPFGATHFYTGIVYRLHSQKPDFVVRSMVSVIDEHALISPLHSKFWYWMANYYLCQLGEVYKAAVPASLKLESTTTVQLVPNDEAAFDDGLRANDKAALAFLANGKLSISQLQKHLKLKNALPLVQRLIAKGYAEVYEDIGKLATPRGEFMLRLANEYQSTDSLNELLALLTRAPKQAELLTSFVQLAYDTFSTDMDHEPLWNKVEIPRRVLLQQSGTSAAGLLQLLRKGFLEQYVAIPASKHSIDPSEIELPALADFQQQAYVEIKEHLRVKAVVLVQGVTGSGKTEIYMHLIRRYLAAGKQVLYLLPEIALTTQIIDRLAKVFGSAIAVYHSRYSEANKTALWQELAHKPGPNGEGPVSLVLGARSAVFLPFRNLGLVIVDEEHETSYKQHEPSPRYHGRDAAIMLAHLHGARVVLGSATPSAESYYNALQGKYGHVHINQRFGSIELPEIKIIDTIRATKRKEMQSLFSHELLRMLEKTLEAQQQVILFQNRRGYSPYIICESCGWVPKCKHCDVSLTYHQHNGSLSCHYCGYTIGNLVQCEQCQQTGLKTRGFGTEKIEEELQLIYPSARVARLDMDTTRTKNAYSELFRKFSLGQIDVLVGTQMVSKGLDFENVHLVGILDADSMLNFPDFRTNERSFQLMEQVSGRAGRKREQGLVLIQTAQPTHPVLHWVKHHRVEDILRAELVERQQFAYPPFTRLIRFTVKHRDAEVAHHAAFFLSNLLRAIEHVSVLGPEPPLVSRVRGLYLQSVLLKMHNKRQLETIKNSVRTAVEQCTRNSNFKGVWIITDVDPV